VTVQVDVPVHAPDQPVKVYPELGVAVSVTIVPDANEPEQVPDVEPAVLKQSMSVGADVTLPVPAPEPSTVSAYVGTNVAVTVRA
jgi:hypothetical protein